MMSVDALFDQTPACPDARKAKQFGDFRGFTY